MNENPIVTLYWQHEGQCHEPIQVLKADIEAGMHLTCPGCLQVFWVKAKDGVFTYVRKPYSRKPGGPAVEGGAGI